jgi:Ni2+-binding GTPase involved in maturation of urease and hydrogenase
MRLHLVGGFLGSGKTTAIIAAARRLMARGLRVGVVTNDQGKYLVDTAFFRLADVPAVEVTGGCFCCNYTDLDQSLDQLVDAARPDVVFAESVGSCADLVATVVKPLLALKAVEAAPASFSVYCDARMLRRRLLDQPMPFSEDVVYIYDKQIEEAGLVVVNKADLLTSAALDEVRDLLARQYPFKPVLLQNSLAEDGVEGWLSLLDSGAALLSKTSLEMDYERYGRGEAQLAWLDETVALESPDGDAGEAVEKVITGMVAQLKAKNASIGHLKFIISGDGVEEKLSIPSLEEPGWQQLFPLKLGSQASLLVNARVEMDAQELRDVFTAALRACGADFSESGVDYFHPKQPNPTHRME